MATLNKKEYADYLKNSMPRTRYFLQRWDLLYEHFECEICDEKTRETMRGRSLRSLKFHPFSGKYLACVNLNVSLNGYENFESNGNETDTRVDTSDRLYKIHICNFLPIVSGTKLDRSIRGDDIIFSNENTDERLGATFMFGNFWIFNTFINTNTQLCHKYKLHNNSTESCTRMYVYDQNSRGNMLFYGNDELRIRDSSKREVLVVDKYGKLGEAVTKADPTIVGFAKNVLAKKPYFLDDVGLFFLQCYEYMKTVFILRRGDDERAVAKRCSNDDDDDNDDVDIDVDIDDNDNGDDPVDGNCDRVRDDDGKNIEYKNENGNENGSVRNYDGATKISKIRSTSCAPNDNDESERAEKNFQIFSPTIDIDDIDNKRISSAPSLYSNLLHTMTQSIKSVLTEIIRSSSCLRRDNRSTESEDRDYRRNVVESAKPLVNNVIVDFAIVSHRAYLLRFISKKMMIRNDWSENMKRFLKTDMKMRQNNKTNASGGSYSVNRNIFVQNTPSVVERSRTNETVLTASPSKPSFVSWRVSIPDIPIESSNVNQQQFYCGKIHDDVEYDHEQIKRLRVVNLNAMKCLMMPKKFERFLSFFNIGNISNAGRIMTSCHSMRESFFIDVSRAIRDVTLLVKYFFRSFETYNLRDPKRRVICSREYWKILVIAVNEIPILSVIGCVDGLQKMYRRSRVTKARVGRIDANDDDDDDKSENATKTSNKRRKLNDNRFTTREETDCDSCVDRLSTFSFWSFFDFIKSYDSSCFVNVVELCKGNYFLDVRVQNDIPTCPVTVDTIETSRGLKCRAATTTSRERSLPISDFGESSTDKTATEASATIADTAALYCKTCREFKPLERSLVVRMPRDYVVDDDLAVNSDNYEYRNARSEETRRPKRKTALPICRRHIWCNRRELELIEFFSGEKFRAPFLHEVACHGLLSILKYPFATDISKIIVSINAHRRALRSINDDYDVLRVFRDYNSNGKINLIRSSKFYDARDEKFRRTKADSLRLFFAFGDFDMNNCEDGYVVDENLDLTVDTIFCKKINVSGQSQIYFRSDMSIEYMSDGRGVRLFVGTLRSETPILFSINSNVQIYRRRAKFPSRCSRTKVSATSRSSSSSTSSIDDTLVNDDDDEELEINDRCEDVYDLYLSWSTSFLQSRATTSRDADDVSVFSPRMRSRGTSTISGKVYSSRRTIATNETFELDSTTSFKTNSREKSFHDDENHDVENFRPSDSINAQSSSSEGFIYKEEHVYDEREISRVSVEIFQKYIQLKLHVKDTRQTIKFQNSFGQKGMVSYRDLSDLITESGNRVDVISSLYSFVGRNACGQFLEQSNTREAIYSRRTGRMVGYGGYGEFFVSDDSSHNNFIYSVKRSGENPMRMCRLTYESLLENEVSSAAFTKACEFELTLTNPYAGLPRNVRSALECYKSYGREIELSSQRIIKLRNDLLNEKILRSLESSATNNFLPSIRT